MSNSSYPLKVAILALPEASVSTVYGMYDLFASTGRDWEMIVNGEPGSTVIEPYTVSTNGRRFQAGNGVWIEPDHALENSPAPDVICIPELQVGPATDTRGCYERETRWIKRHYAAGATLATACSGALLLAETGLLDGQDATTHWGYIDALTSRYPGIRMHPNRALVVSGEGQRIIMGGGVMDQAQLFPMIQEKLQSLLNGYIATEQILNDIGNYIVPPKLGSRAGVLGAIALAQDRLERNGQL